MTYIGHNQLAVMLGEMMYASDLDHTVSSTYDTGFLFGHYKGFSSMNNTFMRALFFSNSNSTFIFIKHFFRGLAGAYVNPGRFSLCAFTCLSNNSLIS